MTKAQGYFVIAALFMMVSNGEASGSGSEVISGLIGFFFFVMGGWDVQGVFSSRKEPVKDSVEVNDPTVTHTPKTYLQISYEVIQRGGEIVELTGVFNSMDHFDRFAGGEHKRPCYSGSKFNITKLLDLTEEQYKAIKDSISGK